jgi:hypothetical protein
MGGIIPQTAHKAALAKQGVFEFRARWAGRQPHR